MITHTPLTSNQNGCITFSNINLKIVYGSYPAAGLSKNTAVGGYIKEIDLSSYGFRESLYGQVSPRYGGFPLTTITSLSPKSITIASNANPTGLYIQWMVIGTY